MKYVFFGPQFEPEYNMTKSLFELKDIDKLDFSISLTPYILKKVCGNFKFIDYWISNYINSVVKKFNININDEIVFVYTEPWYILLTKLNYVTSLRSKYTKSFHVCMLSDSVVASQLNIDELKKVFDKVYIYDLNESARFNIDYIMPVYSKNFNIPKYDDEVFDVSFVGAAKNRLSNIIELYDKLTDIGFSCRFYIVCNEKKEKVHRDGILYSKRYLKEKEYFYSYVAPARCMLEIANPESTALTARVREAIMYDKKIITNNPYLKYNKYYDKNMMYIYDKDLDFGINKSFVMEKRHSYCYDGDFEPINMINKINSDYEKAKV